MSGTPIPTDWDGESWCCYIVEWPDSPSWRRVLTGLLVDPSRGRHWDEATGTITEAQAVGRQIQEHNYLFDEECF